MTWRILCETAELAVQSLGAAQALGLRVSPSAESDVPRAAALARSSGDQVAVVLAEPPSLTTLVELAHRAPSPTDLTVIALPIAHPQRQVLVDVAADLGMPTVFELRPLMALLAMLEAGAHGAYAASTRTLTGIDRQRLKAVVRTSVKASGHLVPVEGMTIGYCERLDGPITPLGEARDVAEALHALQATATSSTDLAPSVDGVDARAVLDVIFGPKRALSDPASKAALAPYGIPLPVEELCSSPSRAAAEAARIGFPVRISLASPDLRVWDHPDLSVDMVDNAARVRDTFRQLMAAAELRTAHHAPQRADAESRLLGVMVTATSDATALLGVRATALPRARVAIEIGFADPHGRAARDETITLLPASEHGIERALRRLAGSALIVDTSPAQRKARLDAISDVLLRVAAFVHDRREEVEAVELRPLALLLDGGVEVREACVWVSDCFERSLDGSTKAAVSGKRT